MVLAAAADSVRVKQRFFEANAPRIVQAAERIAVCLVAGGKLLL